MFALRSGCRFVFMIEHHFVLNEELAADDEEEDYTGEYIRERRVEHELCRDLGGASLHEHQKERREHHSERVELCEPGYHDRGKASAADEVGVDGVRAARDEKQAGYSADGARDYHCADYHLFDVDADVARGVFAFADNGDLIAVLAVFEVDINKYRYNGDDDDVQHILLAEQRREPPLCQQRGTDGVRTALVCHLEEVLDELNGNVVHHQGEERFVGVPECLEHCGNDCPDDAGENACGDHYHEQEPRGDRLTYVEHTHCRDQGADEHLSLGSGVPELHFERRRDGDRDAEQHCDVLRSAPDEVLAERALYHGHEYCEWVVAREGYDDECAEEKRSEDRRGTDAPCPVPCKLRALYKVKTRFMLLCVGFCAGADCGDACFFVFIHWADTSDFVMRTPTSSFLAVRPSSMPVILPALMTIILSHSSRRTSRSSPTKITAAPFSFWAFRRLYII